jgi:putative alpha-1,2-mannosidase
MAMKKYDFANITVRPYPNLCDVNNKWIFTPDIKVNGKEYTHNNFTHEALTKGVTIKPQMSSTPNRSRGAKADDAPYSFSKE